MSLTNLDIITNVEIFAYRIIPFSILYILFYSSLSYFLQFFSIDDKYYPSGSILDFHVIKRHALFLKNGGIEIPFFFFFFKHVKHDHASSDYEIRDSVPVQSPRNIWGVDRRPNRTSANE